MTAELNTVFATLEKAKQSSGTTLNKCTVYLSFFVEQPDGMNCDGSEFHTFCTCVHSQISSATLSFSFYAAFALMGFLSRVLLLIKFVTV